MSTPPKTLTITECHQLLASLLAEGGTKKQFARNIRNYTMAMVMLEAGLRVGELVRLIGCDLYFNDTPVANIAVTPKIAEKGCTREIPVSSRLSAALKQHGASLTTLQRESSHYYVFHSRDPYRPMTTRQVERIIRTASMKALGRPIHPHVLRHTFASRLMRKVNIRIVQELLGHKSITSTQVYTHPNGDDLKNAIDSVEDTEDEKLPKGVQLFRPAGVANRGNASGTNKDIR